MSCVEPSCHHCHRNAARHHSLDDFSDCADTAADPAELKALEVAVRGAALERSIERSQLLARAAEARLLRTQRRAAAGIKSKVSTSPVPAVLYVLQRLRLYFMLTAADFQRTLPSTSAQRIDIMHSASCCQDKERPGKPEDVVRLYDSMAVFAGDLGDLAADVGGAAGEALIDRASAQVRANTLTHACLL